MKENALRPVTMKLDIYGSGDYNGTTIPFPQAYINDALSQNILYYCYDQPGSVEELAKTCGVPGYYIEERIENLLNRDAVFEVSKGRYQTTFIIWSDKHGIYCEENAERALMPIMEKLLKALDGIAEEAAGIGFYKAEKSETDLFYLYGVMAFFYASKHYCELPYPRLKKKYDGYEWNYSGSTETGKHRRIGIGTQTVSNWGSRGGCSHITYHAISGIAYQYHLVKHSSYINACEDIICNGSTEDIDSAADAIQAGYIEKKPDGSLFLTAPFFTKEQKAEFDAIADKYLAPLMPEYSEIVNEFISGYKKLFPRHLNDEVDRTCQGMFKDLYDAVIQYAQRTEAIKMPSPNFYCDVFFQF